MVQIETGINLVYRFDNILDETICDEMIEYLKSNTNIVSYHDNPDNLEAQPYNYSLQIEQCRDPLKSVIDDYASKLAATIAESQNTSMFTETVATVYWRNGTSMDWHPDIRDKNTMSEEELAAHPKNSSLFTRDFTAITYLNDDYEGGETLVTAKGQMPTQENVTQFASKPKKGSVVIYDSACFHKVNEVKGSRFTLAMFFTKEYEYSYWKRIGKEKP